VSIKLLNWESIYELINLIQEYQAIRRQHPIKQLLIWNGL